MWSAARNVFQYPHRHWPTRAQSVTARSVFDGYLVPLRLSRIYGQREGRLRMPRIRSIKPQYFQHEALYEAEIQSGGLPLRLAYIGLWTQCDNRGYFRWRPTQLKLNILPYDACDFSKVLKALSDHGFIIKYEMRGEFFGCVPTFLKHQHPHPKERSDGGIPPPEFASTTPTLVRPLSDVGLGLVETPASRVVDGSWVMDHGSGNGSGQEQPREVLKQGTKIRAEHNPQTCRDPQCCSDGYARAAAEHRTQTS